MIAAVVAALPLVLLAFACAHAEEPETLTLWHCLKGREEEALELVVRAHNLQSSCRIVTMRKEAEPFMGELEAALTAGAGPDLVIWAHDKVGEWSEAGWILPLENRLDGAGRAEYLDTCIQALTYGGHLYGLPLSFETLIMYYNRDLVPRAPATTDEMIAACRRISDPAAGRHGLLYERGNFYHHAMWLHGFGGDVFGPDGSFAARSSAMERSIAFARDLAKVHGIVPDTVEARTQVDLFNEGRAGILLSGPWAYGLIDLRRVNLGIAPLPVISPSGRRATPFMGVKAFFISARTPRAASAWDAARFLTSTYASSAVSIMAGYLPANRKAFDYSIVAADYVTSCFKEQVGHCRPMPSTPSMRRVWSAMMTDPATWRPGCLDRVFVFGEPVEKALERAEEEYRAGASPGR